MFKNAVVAIIALFTLGLPAAAQEPTRQERAAALVSARSWGESEVSEYIRLVSTEAGRSVLLPVTSSGAECERQVAALDSFRLRLQAYPEMGETMTEDRFAAMRVQAVQVGACDGVVAQIDRLSVVRRTLAETSTGILVTPTNPSPAQILLADLSWNSSQVDQYLNLFGTREGRAVLMPATSQRIECERQVAALDSLRLLLQSQPSIGENLTEYRLAGMREHAVELGACDGVVAQIDRITTVRRTLAATSTAIAVDPTNLSRAETLISDASWSESDVTEYIYLITTRTGRAVLLPATTQGDECERQVAALDNFRLRLQAHPQIIESLTEERLVEMRADALGVGACRGVVAQIDRLSVVRRTLAETSTGTAVAPASDTPETSAEEIEDGSIVDEEADVLRHGQSLFDVELRADCSVYYRRTLVQGRTEGEYGEDGNCELLPTIHRSPSGRWIAVHTPLNNYSFGRVAMVDTVAERVAVPPREFVPNGRLFPLNVWSPDENRLLMTELSFLGPPINDFYQLAVMVPCEFDIAAVALNCIDRDRFASALQAAALRASPLARCLPQRSCYLVMDISEPRFEAGELAYTGTVQLLTLEAGGSTASGPSISETFVPGEDIVWFEFSGRGPRSTAQDITLRVLDPLVEPNIARVQPEAPPPATAPDLRLQPVQVACVRPGGRGGPITVTPGGQIMLGETPLFRGSFRWRNLAADYAFLVRPANSAYRLVLGSFADLDSGPVEAAIVDGASMRVVHPGILGPGRVRGVAPAQNVVQFPGQCGSDGPYEPISWRSFGGGRYVAGLSTPSEGSGALVIIDLQTGLWAQWEPSPATYPAPRRRLPAGETSADWMLFHAEPGRSQITAIDSQTGQITLSATFSFDCNPWQGARDGSDADICLIGGIPDSNNEANNSPELRKSYNTRLQLGR